MATTASRSTARFRFLTQAFPAVARPVRESVVRGPTVAGFWSSISNHSGQPALLIISCASVGCASWPSARRPPRAPHRHESRHIRGTQPRGGRHPAKTTPGTTALVLGVAEAAALLRYLSSEIIIQSATSRPPSWKAPGAAGPQRTILLTGGYGTVPIHCARPSTRPLGGPLALVERARPRSRV